MSIVDGGPNTAGLVARVQNILLRPVDEWNVIDGEAATTQSLFVGYACILAAIPAVAGFLSSALFGHNLFGGLFGALFLYGFSLAAVFVESIIINALATSFDATSNSMQALKVAVYANTAFWVAGAAHLIPFLGGLIWFAGFVYTCYLLYLGLGKLMKTPADKLVGYTAVSIGAYMLLFGVVVWLSILIVALTVAGAMIGAGAALH